MNSRRYESDALVLDMIAGLQGMEVRSFGASDAPSILRLFIDGHIHFRQVDGKAMVLPTVTGHNLALQRRAQAVAS